MKVYLSEHIAPSAYRRLTERFEVVDNFDHPEELVGIIIRRAEVTRKVLERAVNLKVISMHGVGTDTIDMEAARELGIPVINVPGQGTEAVAELTVALLLELSRKLPYAEQGLKAGRFPRFGDTSVIGTELYGKRLGLFGDGRIAGRVAEILRVAFCCEVSCYNPHKTAQQLAAQGYRKVETVEELLRENDLVSIHAPATGETRNLISAAALAQANPGLLLVATSRGGVVDEAALYEALKAKKIRGAALDVFASEPPSPEHPLLSLPNFIGTFHIGGSTEESLDRVGNRAVDNLFRAVDGI